MNSFNAEEIYSILKSGKSADDIAKEFADNLNAAVARQEAAKKEELERKKKEESRLNITRKIYNDLKEYVDTFYPKWSCLLTDESPETLDKTLAEAFKSIEAFDKHISAFERFLRS